MTLTFAKISPWIAEVFPPTRVKGGRVLLDEGGDFFRGIILDRSIDSDCFFIQLFLDTHYDPSPSISFLLGDRINMSSSKNSYWSKSDPNLKQNIQQAVLRDAPPFFAATDGHDKIMRALEEGLPIGNARRWYYVGCCHARQGRLREANRCWNLVFDKTTAEVPWQNELRGWAGELLAHFEKSDAAGQAKLDELVAQSRLLLKL